MEMQEHDFYSNAHLLIAAIRIVAHQNSAPASIEDVCKVLSYSPEQGSYICRKLKEMEIIDMIEGAYGIKLFIKNHIKMEEIPRGHIKSKIEKELQEFQSSKKHISEKIESIKSEQAKKKQHLFADLEQQLKKGLEKK